MARLSEAAECVSVQRSDVSTFASDGRTCRGGSCRHVKGTRYWRQQTQQARHTGSQPAECFGDGACMPKATWREHGHTEQAESPQGLRG
jgi:NAD-dependent dihydropyrimidine dehydrogenase PreA subunit